MHNTKPKKILICGGRDYQNMARFDEVMFDCVPYFDEDYCIIQGGAKGADALAKEWAKENGRACIQVSANWDYYNNQAGFIRNKWMLVYCQPDLVIAFPGGTGTKNMVKLSKNSMIPVYEVE